MRLKSLANIIIREYYKTKTKNYENKSRGIIISTRFKKDNSK